MMRLMKPVGVSALALALLMGCAPGYHSGEEDSVT